MTLMIHCQRCGQVHLIGEPCQPHNLFNKDMQNAELNKTQKKKIKAFKNIFKIVDKFKIKLKNEK